ncbi:MAG: tetratricopeptide repeat protein [Bacteroidetes bacterium]|nr:tetratricopeptide repeat protein [Bacteroidota bacterium]
MNYEELKALLTQADELNISGNYDEAEKLAQQVLSEVLLKEDAADRQGVYCSALLTFSDSARRKGDYDLALASAHTSLDLATEHLFPHSKARAQNSIGNVHWRLGSSKQALEYYHYALESLEEIGDKRLIGGTTVNIGNVYRDIDSYEKALEYYTKALAIFEEIGEKYFRANVIGNIGSLYGDIGTHDMALEYFQKALAAHEELANISGVAANTANIGSLFTEKKYEGYDAAKAEEYLLKALSLSTETGRKEALLDCHRILSMLYENEERTAEAFVHYKKYIDLEKKINAEEVKKQSEQREREKEIAIAKASADAKMSATTSLLHKVLPESIATRIIGGETEIADYFPQVSILFADIAGFTPISADMPAFVVVRFLNFVFGEFDRIIKKHGCEKIKTIGDGYMAVAGAPVECTDHAERLARAALEMQETISLPSDIRQHMPEGAIHSVRIGLHTGSVVAGVIGEERFVYDIYSDAVNTASRMESHGEAGKIHVSEDFRNALISTTLNDLPIQFIPRGEMDIKGKGIMTSYFLEKLQ